MQTVSRTFIHSLDVHVNEHIYYTSLGKAQQSPRA